MPLPEDVSTFTLIFDEYLDALGTVAHVGLQGLLTPVDDVGRPVRILHPGTGKLVVPLDIPVTIGEDGTASISGLPHTDNSNLFPHPFRYKMTWLTAGLANVDRLRMPKSLCFVATVANGDVLRYNKLEPAVGVPGVSVFVHGLPIGGLTNYVLAKKSATDFDAKWMSLSGYVSDGQLANTLTDYVTDDALAAALEALPEPDFTPYATNVALAEAVEATNSALANAVAANDAVLTGYVTDDELADALEAIGGRFITPAERLKLTGIEVEATHNAPDAALRDRQTHTGLQSTATIADLREYIEDTIGGMLRAVGADLDISYDDASGDLTIDYTGTPNDPETIRDTIGAAMVGLGNIAVLVNDEANTITITTAATVNDTNAALRDRGTHTGVQPAATISDFATATLAVVQALLDALGVRIDTEVADRTAADTALSGRIATNEGLLTAATDANVPNTLAKRDVSGNVSFNRLTVSQAPAAAGQVTRKDYVDTYGSTTPVDIQTTAFAGSYDLSGWATPGIRGRTLSGNVTFTVLPGTANYGAGKSAVVTLLLKQAATGGPFTVTWPATGITWLTPVPAMPTAASATMRVELIWTGTEWLGVAAEADLAAATVNSTPNTLARRDANGNVTFARAFLGTMGTNASEVTRKDYVDTYGSTVSAASVATTGVQSLPGIPAMRTYTLAGNTTIGAPGTPTDATRAWVITLVLKQAATGGPFTLTWPGTGINWLTPIPTMPTAASATMQVELVWTGTEWLGIAAEADLAAATDQNVGGRLVRRDAGGSVTASRTYSAALTPNAISELTRKDYVDTYGQLSPSIQGNVTGNYGLDATKLPSTRVFTLTGNLTVTPTTPTPASTVSGLFALVLKQAATGTGPFTVTWGAGINWLTAAPVMPTTAGATLRVEFIWTGTEWLGVAAEADLAAATSTTPTGNALVRRDSSGNASFGMIGLSATPTTAQHATRKDYVDTQDKLVAPLGISAAYTTVLADATREVYTTGTTQVNVTIPPSTSVAYPLGTVLTLVQSGTGLLALAAGAGVTIVVPTGFTQQALGVGATVYVRKRDTDTWEASGDLVAATPTAASHLTRKDYVDTYGALSPSNIVTGLTAGTYTPGTNWLPSARTWVLAGNIIIGALPTTGLPSDRAGTATLILKQPATGGPFTVTWPTIVWAGGAAAPVMPTAANAELIVHLFWTGTAWRGMVAGSFFP